VPALPWVSVSGVPSSTNGLPQKPPLTRTSLAGVTTCNCAVAALPSTFVAYLALTLMEQPAEAKWGAPMSAAVPTTALRKTVESFIPAG
jgi:hypothetical protein